MKYVRASCVLGVLRHQRLNVGLDIRRQRARGNARRCGQRIRRQRRSAQSKQIAQYQQPVGLRIEVAIAVDVKLGRIASR